MRCYLGGHSKLNIVSRDRQGSGFPRGLWFIFCDIVGPTSQSIPFQGMLRGALRRGGKIFFKNLFRRKVRQCSYCGDRYTDDQYSAEHKATGHKWVVNESPADPADLTDAEGWKVVKAADCLNAAQLQRTCSVCGETEEKVGAAATGHFVSGMAGADGKVGTADDISLNAALKGQNAVGGVCHADQSLVDAEGNKIYAFECENENCPVEVVVDARGNTKHYIKAVEHTMKLDTTHDKYDPASCEEGGNDVFKCEVCGEVDEENATEKLGHTYNTLQSDGKTAVVVCVEDKGINTEAKYLAFMRSLVGNATYTENQDEYIKAWKAAYGDPDNKAAVGADGTFAISQVCTRCGAPTAALGHKYIVAKYVEGSFTEVEKDEDGAIVDYSEEVNVATMNCRYVQLCSGCGDVAKRGAHQNVPAATCRENGVCPDCGRPVNAQLKHQYVNVSSFVNAKGEFIANVSTGDSANATTEGYFIGTKIKRQAAYDAWKKLSATETWLVPVVGDCDSKSTDVTVCVQCLVDALDEKNEVVWNQATEKPENLPTTATSTNAYVITLDNTHDYQPFYYDLDGTEIEWNMTNCQIGYLVRYECSKCREVYKNVLVADDPATTAENTDEGENGEELWNEARNNKYAELNIVKGNGVKDKVSFFTDDEGFVLNIQPTGDYTAEKVKAEGFKTTGVAQEDNKDRHSLYLEAGYKPIKAATCANVEIDPYYCENCGTVVEMAAGKLDANKKPSGASDAVKDEDGKADETFVYAEVTATNGYAVASTALNKSNHEGKPEDCGVHCDYKVNNQLVCGGYGDTPATDRPTADHSTFTISYKLMSTISAYYSDYTLQVARVTDDKVNPTIADDKDTFANHVIGLYDGTKVSKCLGNAFELPLTTEYVVGTTKVDDTVGYNEYLVLVDAEGNMYQVIGDVNTSAGGTEELTYYTEDASEEGKPNGNIVGANPTVNGDDTYFVAFTTKNAGSVTAAPVSASDETSLELALGQKPDTVKENGKDVNVLTVNVAKSFEIDTLPTVPTKYPSSSAEPVTIDRVVFDLNGNTLKIDASNWIKRVENKDVPYGWSIESNVTFSDGAISVTNSNLSVGAFSVADEATFTLDNVALSTSGSAVVLQPQGGDNVGGTFNLIDSTVYAGSQGVCVIAVSTNASASSTPGLTDDNKVTINIENSNIYTYAPTAVNASDYAMDSTALLINVPADVTIEGSALVGTRQALVVRGGNAEISDSTLTVVRVADPADTDDPGDVNQKWDQGNQMPAGALVIGNDDLDTTKAESTAEAYQYKTTVILDSDVVLSVTDTSNSTAKVVIGSDFANETLENQKDTKWPAGTTDKTYANISTMPIMVYLNGGGVLSGSDISYVRTWDKGTTQLVNCGDMSGIR